MAYREIILVGSDFNVTMIALELPLDDLDQESTHQNRLVLRKKSILDTAAHQNH